MATYVIADLRWMDQRARDEYGRRAPAALARYGGRYVVRGGAPRSLEGEWEPSAIAVIEFPSAEAARQWYDSEEYRPLKTLRLAAATTSAIMVDGAPWARLTCARAAH